MSRIVTFETLDEAARASFPASCRLVALHEHGDTGFALFNTREIGAPYLYEVYFDRQDGRWSEGSSSNGPGWHRTDSDGERGVVSKWGEVPRGADRAQVEFRGRVWEEPVANDAYLFLWWDEPSPKEHPELVAFRVDGEWIRQR